MNPINYFDRIEALYWFCADYHSGQASFLYELLCRVCYIYDPGLLTTGPGTADSKQYYKKLVQKYKALGEIK
jgi:uncharacterized protein (DUF488 family)